MILWKTLREAEEASEVQKGANQQAMTDLEKIMLSIHRFN